MVGMLRKAARQGLLAVGGWNFKPQKQKWTKTTIT
jgi:hypothetical protein